MDGLRKQETKQLINASEKVKKSRKRVCCCGKWATALRKVKRDMMQEIKSGAQSSALNSNDLIQTSICRPADKSAYPCSDYACDTDDGVTKLVHSTRCSSLQLAAPSVNSGVIGPLIGETFIR